MIDLNPKHLKTIQYILAEYIPDYEVRAFGSRVKWTAKDYSDLDLVVVGSKPLNLRQRGKLVEAFEESNLPIRVDVLDWQSISEGFRQVISERYEVIQKVQPVDQNENPEGINGKWSTKRGWQAKTFGDCAMLIRESISPADLGDTPYIGLEHIGENTLSLIEQGVASDITSTKSRFRKGDILFGKLRCYFRKVVTAPFDGVCSTDIWITRAKDGVDQGFLYYCMASQSFVDFADSGSEGTRMPRAQWEWVARYKIPLPSLSEQRRIAHILGTLDQKIELNRQMNKTLEATARAIFKSWFVDFTPVKAKMEGRKPPCMDTETAALFPSAFKDSALGNIPHGWQVTTIDEDFNLTMGQSPPGSTYNEDEEGMSFYQGRKDFGFRYPTRRVYCTAPKRFAEKGDTVVSVRAPVGDVNMVKEKCSIGRGVAAIRHKSGSRSYTYYTMQSLQEVFSRYEAEGTVFGSINKTDFQTLSYLRPPDEIVEAFEGLVFPLDQTIENNENESRTLAQTRDTLLPKLLSGEICVDEATEILEENDG